MSISFILRNAIFRIKKGREFLLSWRFTPLIR